MKSSLVAFALVSTGLVFGCQTAPKGDGSSPAAAAAPEKAVSEVPVAKVAELLKEKSAVVLDANDTKTRQEYGVVPGAVLLSSHSDYALSELPSNKSDELVFYCGGVKCRASDKAAARASAAGYTQVSVMREGIRGWKSAGMPTATPQS